MMEKRARILGWLLQGFVTGCLLFAAIYKLVLMSSNARIFRYQEF